jgi:NAD(P)-dependent dehydrogenase (short-subunit alcohol dehydrogenase family)
MSDVRVAIVGAYGGIGQSLCREVLEQGGQARLIGRDVAKLEGASSEFGFAHFVADATDWDQLDRAIELAQQSMQGLNAVVCLAGSVLLKPLHLTSRSEWDSTLQTNLTAAAGTLRSSVSRMPDGGSVVLMSSAAAQIGLSNHEAIAASKAGIEGLVRSAAMTYAAKRIRVNAIAPGLVQTPLTQRVWGNARSAEVSLAMHPLGRFGQPDEIARAIYFLIDPRNQWITGQTLGVDGGLGTLKPTGTTIQSRKD